MPSLVANQLLWMFCAEGVMFFHSDLADLISFSISSIHLFPRRGLLKAFSVIVCHLSHIINRNFSILRPALD